VSERWLPGRQGTGYQKRPLLQLWFLDAYLLRFPEGSHVPEHTDQVLGCRHWRLNLVLRRALRGGEFVCGRAWRLGRLALFRPDTEPHSVTRIDEGTRYVLSLGCALPRRARV
jgi:hypothetical protein